MKNDDEKQCQTTMQLDSSISPVSELETLRSRLRWAQDSQGLAVRILALLNRRAVGLDAIREILRLVKEFTGFEAVGIRLRDGEDFPYFETQGFPDHFVEVERSLCSRTHDGEIIRDSVGNPVLECMCGNVIQGRTNPSFPFFTQGGSFWSNCTTELLAATSEEDRQARTRNRCNGEGYESVALIPLRSDRDIVGLLQLNDSRKNRFAPDMIDFLEGIGASIGTVLERKRMEQERDRFFNLSIDMLCVAGFDGIFKQVNPAFTETLGWAREELLSRPWIEFVHPDDRAETIAAGGRLISGERLHFYENRYRRKDGSFRWLSWNCLPIPGEDLIYAVARDVTERKQSEERLRRDKDELELRVDERTATLREVNEKLVLEISERKRAEDHIKRAEAFLNMLVDNLPIPVFAKSAKDGQFILWNKASETLFGLTKEQVIGKTDYEFFPKEQADFFWEKDSESFASGVIVDIPEEPIFSKSLGPRILHTSKVPVYDKAGQPSYLLGISQDITERKRAEEALQTSEERYRTLVENVDVGISLIDSDHNIIVSNNIIGKWFDKPASEFSGKKCFQEFERREAVCEHCPGERAMATGRPAEAEREGVRDDGSSLVVRIRAFPALGQDGLATGFTEVIEDITERREAEKALRESEQRFRAVFENNHVVMLIIDPETGRIEDASPGACAFYGYDREELKHKALSEINILSPEQLFQRMRTAKFQQRKYFDFQHRLASGEIRDVEVCTGPIASDGRTLLFSVITDVTDRKRVEQALKESEEEYRAVFDNAGIGIDVVDRELRLVQANPALLKMLGYTEEELRQVTVTDIIHPDDRASTRENLNALMGGLTGPYRIEKRYLKKDGSFIWADLSASPIWDAEGKPKASVGVIADITERKRTEEALRESEQRYRKLFDESRDGVYLCARDGLLDEANQAFLDLFGLTREEAMQWNLVEAYRDPADRTRFQETIERNGSVVDYEVKLKKKDGTEIDCLITSTLRLDENGTILGYQGIIRDMTDRKRLEQQLLQAQKMEAIGTLAGGIAHDFNNLLTVILGYSELIISEKNEHDRDYQDLKKVIHAGRSAGDMVQQILAFSRKTETKFWPINLNKQIPQLRKMLSRLLPRTIEVQIDLAPELPTVNADPAQIDQILMNLAVNARDAMPDGGSLTIETRAVVLDNEYCSTHIEASRGLHALLTVRDTGIGIDRASSDRIFEPFYTTKKLGQGTGLGLSMVYGIVKGHGGHIAMHSEPGVGTTFKIYLPAHQVQAEPDMATSAAFAAMGTGTILLADDEELVRSLGERILQISGYKVLTACDGRKAVEIYRQKKDVISLVILDLIMPVMDGKQCLDEILKVNPHAKVLIASGYSPDGATKDILASGAKGFVNKPYEIRQLVQSVRETLDS